LLEHSHSNVQTVTSVLQQVNRGFAPFTPRKLCSLKAVIRDITLVAIKKQCDLTLKLLEADVAAKTIL